MRKFRFPLQRLLRLREQRERIARRDLAAAMAEVAEIRGRLHVLQRSLQACREEIVADAPSSELAKALENGLLANRKQLNRHMAEADKRAEQCRVAYREQQRDVTALRRLRERRYAAWRTEMERESQAELDEMARVRYANQRRKGAGG